LGFGNGDDTFQPAVDFPATGWALDTADFNLDGWPDVCLGSNGSAAKVDCYYAGDGGVLLAQPELDAGTMTSALALADFNRDAVPDLVVANAGDNSLTLFSDVSFGLAGSPFFLARTDYPLLTRPTSVAVGDFNNDGFPDILATDGPSNHLVLFLSNGDGTFASPVRYPVWQYPISAAVGDFNGDGLLDVAVANKDGQNLSVLYQTGCSE
jgi:hypothetical protein